MPCPRLLSSATPHAYECDFIRVRCFAALNACLGTGNHGSFSIMNPSICRTLSTICFQGGILSILLSIWIWWVLNGDSPEEQAHAERFGIFVGLWAPTLLILSNRFDRYADKARSLPGLNGDETKENA
jgi:hypothetical protein